MFYLIERLYDLKRMKLAERVDKEVAKNIDKGDFSRDTTGYSYTNYLQAARELHLHEYEEWEYLIKDIETLKQMLVKASNDKEAMLAEVKEDLENYLFIETE